MRLQYLDGLIEYLPLCFLRKACAAAGEEVSETFHSTFATSPMPDLLPPEVVLPLRCHNSFVMLLSEPDPPHCCSDPLS